MRGTCGPSISKGEYFAVGNVGVPHTLGISVGTRQELSKRFSVTQMELLMGLFSLLGLQLQGPGAVMVKII